MTALIVVIGLITVDHWPRSEFSGISYDSIRYYAGTESILMEGHYRDLDGRPQQVWPPGLSLLYAFVSRLSNQPPLDLVAPIDSISYVMSIALLAFLLYRSAVRWPIAMLAVAALAWNGYYLSIHNKLWSEPPTLAFFVAAIVCLTEFARKTKRSTAWFLAALLCTATCILLRYAFLPLVLVAAGLAAWQRRWLHATFAALTPIPTIVALAALGAATPGNRSMGVQPVVWSQFSQAFVSLSEQMFPGRFGGGTVTILFALVTFIIPIVALKTSEHGPGVVTTVTGLAWLFVYVSFLMFTQMTAVPPPIVDLRMLIPLYFTAIVAAATASEMLIHRRQWLAAVVIIGLALASFRAARFTVGVYRSQPPAADCVSREWYVGAIRKRAPQGTIVTNAQGTVWLALHRPIFSSGDGQTVIWIDAQRACDGVVEQLTTQPPSAPNENGLVIYHRVR